MTYTRTIKRGAAAAFCLVAVVGAAAPAVGAHSSSRTGVSTWTNDDHTLYVSDTANDDNDVYGEMTRQGVSGTSKLRNSNGNGSTVYRTYGATILSVRGCVDDFGSDTCAAWG